jgi:cell division septation protein DedD
MNAVALHAIDVITVPMDFDRGADHEERALAAGHRADTP